MIPYGERIILEFIEDEKQSEAGLYRPEFRGNYKKAIVKAVGEFVKELSTDDKVFTKTFRPVTIDNKDFVFSLERNIPAKYE